MIVAASVVAEVAVAAAVDGELLAGPNAIVAQHKVTDKPQLNNHSH